MAVAVDEPMASPVTHRIKDDVGDEVAGDRQQKYDPEVEIAERGGEGAGGRNHRAFD